MNDQRPATGSRDSAHLQADVSSSTASAKRSGVQAAGAAPTNRRRPGHPSSLDRDDDLGCEP